MTASSTALPSAGDLLASTQRLLAAYQRRVRLRRLLRLAVGAGCVAALLWRGRLLGWAPPFLIGAGAAAIVALGVWQWIVSRREQPGAGLRPYRAVGPEGDAIALDRMLGLKARLITTIEFADQPNASSLYPTLARETSEAIRGAASRLPKPIDRPTMALGAALLLLLLSALPAPPPRATQLASVPVTPPPIPPQEPPPQPQDQSGSSNASQSQQQSGGGQSSQQQQSGGGQSSQPQQQQGSQSQQSPSQSGSQPQPSGGSQPGQQQQSQGGQQQPSAGQQPGQQQPGRQSAQQPGQQGQQPGQQGKQANQANASQSQRSQQANAGSKSNASSAKASQSSSGVNSRQGTGGQSKNNMDGTQAGLSPSQQQLRGDIQQLLKDLSGELKELQAELQQRPDQPPAAPGTSTDSQLYDAAQALEASAARTRVPIQLQSDDQPVSSTRKGGGTGTAGRQASSAAPQQAREDAQLSEQPAPEGAAERPAIPPDYRPVFERVSHADPKEPQ